MKHNNGFTIMELMTVIAIIGILSAVAVPNMISWRSNQQLSSSAREILSFLNGARLQAIKGNSNVTITLGTGVKGKEIQSSQRNRSIENASDPGATIELSMALRPGITMTSNFKDDEVAYNARGILTNNIPGTIKIANSKGTQLKIVVASTGLTRITKD